MLTAQQVQKIISENEFLQVQLDDINLLLRERETELLKLREIAKNSISLKSTIEQNLEELSYLQHQLGKKQQTLQGSYKREAEMEKELLVGIKMERAYFDIHKKFESSTAQILDITGQLDETADVFKNLRDAKKKIASMQSELDILNEEKEFLHYENSKLKKRLESLQQQIND